MAAEFSNEVSVPFRGFRGLQVRGQVEYRDVESWVSVPFRGFRGLQAGTLGEKGCVVL